MVKATFILIVTALIYQGYGLPTNSTVKISNNHDSEHCGQVTNVIVNGAGGGGVGDPGPQGEKGEMGSRGAKGEKGQRGIPGQNAGGVVFTIWGRDNCPSTSGTQRLYQGSVAGSRWDEGGSAEYLCLHEEPQYLSTTSGYQENSGRLHGVEYHVHGHSVSFAAKHGHDAPCSVCYAPTRSVKIMIPGRISCPPMWTREYYGYLMGDRYTTSHHGKVPVCVDQNPESVPGSLQKISGSDLFFIETTCTGIKCPPYSEGAEITCVVCTK